MPRPSAKEPGRGKQHNDYLRFNGLEVVLGTGLGTSGVGAAAAAAGWTAEVVEAGAEADAEADADTGFDFSSVVVVVVVVGEAEVGDKIPNSTRREWNSRKRARYVKVFPLRREISKTLLLLSGKL